MADEKKDQQDAGEAKKPGLLDNKVVVLGGVVALQLLLAVGLTTMVIMPRLGASQAGVAANGASVATAEEMGVLLSLGEIIVTLQGESGLDTRYLRINVDLELEDQSAANLAASRLPILRDTVIVTLTDRRASELNRPEGMKGLRDELMRRLDERLPGGVLRHIYFSDLVIQ
jgi:flagellar FliL protein